MTTAHGDAPAIAHDNAKPRLQTAGLTHLREPSGGRASFQVSKTFLKNLGPSQLKVMALSVIGLIAANPSLNHKGAAS